MLGLTTLLRFFRGKESHPFPVTRDYEIWDARRDRDEDDMVEHGNQRVHMENIARYKRYFAITSQSPFKDDEKKDILREICKDLTNHPSMPTAEAKAVTTTTHTKLK